MIMVIKSQRILVRTILLDDLVQLHALLTVLAEDCVKTKLILYILSVVVVK